MVTTEALLILMHIKDIKTQYINCNLLCLTILYVEAID